MFYIVHFFCFGSTARVDLTGNRVGWLCGQPCGLALRATARVGFAGNREGWLCGQPRGLALRATARVARTTSCACNFIFSRRRFLVPLGLGSLHLGLILPRENLFGRFLPKFHLPCQVLLSDQGLLLQMRLATPTYSLLD